MENSNIQIAANNFYNYTAEIHARKFISKLTGGQYVMEQLTNRYIDFTGNEEFQDYKDYCTLLKSRAGVLFVKSLK